jgi:hypothetical protein
MTAYIRKPNEIGQIKIEVDKKNGNQQIEKLI